MTQESVSEYLLSKPGFSGGGSQLLLAINSEGRRGLYEFSVEDAAIHPSLRKHLKEINLTPAEVSVPVNRALDYLREGVDVWVELHLGRKIAEKYNIEAEEGEKSLFFTAVVATKEEADTLVNAVREYDHISHSPEMEELEVRVPKVIEEGLAALLEKQ